MLKTRSLLLLAIVNVVCACPDWPALGLATTTGIHPTDLVGWQGRLVVAADSTRLLNPKTNPPTPLQALPPCTSLEVSGELLLGWGGSEVRGWRMAQDGRAETAFQWDPADQGQVESAAWMDGWLYVTTRHWDDIPGPWDWGWQVTRIVDLRQPEAPQVAGQLEAGLVAVAGERLLVGGCVYSLEDPACPHLLVNTYAEVCGVAVAESQVAWVCNDGNQLLLGDLSNPAHFIWESRELVWGGFWDATNLYQLAWVNDGLVIANLNQGFTALGRNVDGDWTPCATPLYPWSWPQQPLATAVAVAGGRLWLAGEYGDPLAFVPLFGPVEDLELQVGLENGDAQLEWQPGPNDLWTVYRSESPDFPPDQAVCLGSVKVPRFVDESAQAEGLAFYRVKIGRPD